MRNITFTILIIVLAYSSNLYGAWGLFSSDRSYIVINGTTYSVWNDGTGNVQNADLGTFINAETLTLTGYDVKTWKNSGGDVTGGAFYYLVYPKGNRPASPVFTQVTINWIENLGNEDQKWGFSGQNIDLLNSLSAGEFTLEFYAEMYGTSPDKTEFDNNGGENYLAHFSFNYVRSIVDGNWDQGSSWSNSKIPGSNQTAEVDHSIIVSSDISVNSLIINSGKALTINAGQSLTVNGTLTNNAGTAGLVIKSDATGTGSLIHSSTGVSGTADRHIAGFTTPTSGWHFLSSPVSAQPISVFHTAGSGDDFYKWDEPSGEWINRTATGGGLNGSFETNFTVGVGYLIANGTTSTKEFSGTLNVSDVTVTGLTNTSSSTHQGWHLLGNPFSSAIKFNQGTWSRTNIGVFAQIWNESTASYKVLAGNQIIPAHNGFMVYTTGSGSLTIPADARLHSDSAWYKNTFTGNEIVLIARDPEGQTAQETIISFNPEATEGFDLQYDSYYLSGFAPRFYSISQNQLYALNAIPSLTDNLEIQLGFVKNQSSFFIIEILQTIDEQTLYLIDQKAGYTHKLSDGPYQFTAESGDNPNRFLLRFSAVGIDDVSMDSPVHAWVYNNNLFVNNSQSSIFVEIFDMMGRRLLNRQMTGDGMKTMYLDQPAGVYLVKISSSTGVHTIKATITN